MAQQRAIPAKIVRPTTKGVLLRERLFERLDAAAGRAAVWVSGPAGAGKTTLVSSYIEARGLPCLWVQVDPGDADLASFFYYLGLAADRAAPHKKPLPLLTPEYLQGLPAFCRNFFETLCGRLRDGSALVFDNCREVPESSLLHGALLEGMSRMGDGTRLILLGRGSPPPAYARLRAHGEMVIIGGEELRLTPEEFAGVADLRGLGGSPEELQRLHGVAQGWAAGLQILLEVSRTQSVLAGALGGAIPEEIFDYFGGVIFERLDAESQSFLLQTSVLPSMTSSLAEELTGNPGASRLLSTLHRRGDFTERRAHADAVYQYHPLFREFLQRRAQELLGKVGLAAVQRRAGALLAGAGLPEDAAVLLTGAGDWQGLAELAAAHAQHLLGQGRNETLERWLRALPEAVLASAPWLLYWRGAARLPHDPAEAQRCFERAFAGFHDQGDGGPGLLLAWAGAVASISLAFSDFHLADPWLDLLPTLVGNPRDLPPGEVGAHVAHGALAILALRAPNHPALPAWEERALSLEATSDDLACRVGILFNATWLTIMRGRRAPSQALLDRLKALVGSGPVSPLAEIFQVGSDGLFCWYYDDLERSIAAFRRAMELGERTGVRLLEPMTLSYLGQVELAVGDRAAVEECLAQTMGLLSSPTIRPLDRLVCTLFVGRAHLADGELAKSMQFAREAELLCRATGVVGCDPYAFLLTAQAFRGLGNRRQAFRRLAAALRSAIQNQTTQLVFSSLLLAAQLHFDAGRGNRARAAIRSGFALGRELEARRPYAFSGPPLAALCAEALEAKIEVDYVRSLIRHNRLTPPPGHEPADAWPWPVRVQTLGGFEVYLGGEPLRIGRKAPRKPLDLLKALIAYGGRGVAEGLLADALWPDADGAAARKAFEIALHRLRKLLGVKEALVVHEGRLTLDNRVCWVDAHAFERLLKDGHGADKRESPSESLVSKERALALYQGPFLAGDDDAWVILPRERLRNRYLRAVVNVAAVMEAGGSGGAETAVDWYRKGLEVDPLAEDLYQGLIRCHTRLGRRAEAVSVFRRCRQVLAKVLGVEPSAATVALAEAARP